MQDAYSLLSHIFLFLTQKKSTQKAGQTNIMLLELLEK